MYREKQARKRIASILLTFMMIFSLIPVAVSAHENIGIAPFSDANFEFSVSTSAQMNHTVIVERFVEVGWLRAPNTPILVFYHYGPHGNTPQVPGPPNPPHLDISIPFRYLEVGDRVSVRQHDPIHVGALPPEQWAVVSAVNVVVYEIGSGTPGAPGTPGTPDDATNQNNDNNNNNNDNNNNEGMSFVDVTPDNWFYDAVRYVYENDIMRGTSDTMFSPNSTLTRAMVLTILHRLEDEMPVFFRPVFIDIAEDRWYSDGVIWGYDAGVVRGVGDNRFAPNYSLTREQLTAMMFRFAVNSGYDVSAPEVAVAGTSEWALEYMRWAVYNDFISVENPRSAVSRAEIANFIYQFSLKYRD